MAEPIYTAKLTPHSQNLPVRGISKKLQSIFGALNPSSDQILNHVGYKELLIPIEKYGNLTLNPQLTFWMHKIHLSAIDSTNTYAKQHASSFPKGEITRISADEQTAGRGRQNRSWVSPKDVNIYATFFFELPMHTRHLSSIGQVLALRFALVLEHHGLSPRIKWPNDIQLREKKVAGILCETAFVSGIVQIFLGIGINVNMDDLHHIDQPATSLKFETGRVWDREELLQELETQFLVDLERFCKEGFTPFHAPFNELLAFKGEKVSCFDGKRLWEGVCESVASDGQLNLLLGDGQIKTLTAADVSVRRLVR